MDKYDLASEPHEPTEFDEQEQKKRDKLLHKLLKTPPQPRSKRVRARANADTKKVVHVSGCAVNNAPAYEPGHCDCGASKAER